MLNWASPATENDLSAACADVGSFFRLGPPTALYGLVHLIDALLEQFLGTPACHAEVQPHAITATAGRVQADRGPGEHAGKYLQPSGRRPDPEREHHGERGPADDQAVRSAGARTPTVWNAGSSTTFIHSS